ncbi:MAG: hypothetical protein ACRESR_02365 [Gammaproteobacteria bacterium]
MNKARFIGRKYARDLTVEEINSVSGGDDQIVSPHDDQIVSPHDDQVFSPLDDQIHQPITGAFGH